MIEELLSYGPFGAAVGQVLQAMDVARRRWSRSSARAWAANGLTPPGCSADIDAAWAQF